MGGFVFDTDDAGEEPYIDGSPRVTLTLAAIEDLASLGYLPDMPMEAIQDKSKQDGIGKTLVLLQASWLILQCVGRAIHRLPLSYLELNTLAHAVCALAMYLCWWFKPLDIREPTVLQGEWARDLCAMMYTATIRRSDEQAMVPSAKTKLKFQVAYCNDHQNLDAFLTEKFAEATGSRGYRSGQSLENPNRLLSLAIHDKLAESYDVVALNLNSSSLVTSTLLLGGLYIDPTGKYPLKMTLAVLRRLRLIKQCMSQYPSFFTEFQSSFRTVQGIPVDWHKSFHVLDPKLTTATSDSMHLAYRSGNLGWSFIGHGNREAAFYIAATCACIYGGISAAAWNDVFPTRVEQLLWRISAIIITGTGPLLGFLNCIYSAASDKPKDKYDRPGTNTIVSSKKPTKRFVSVGLFEDLAFAAISLWLICVLARLYIIVEAFAALRSAPAALYSTPRWSTFLPHFH